MGQVEVKHPMDRGALKPSCFDPARRKGAGGVGRPLTVVLFAPVSAHLLCLVL